MEISTTSAPPLPAHVVERSVRLSYLQAMLGAIYSASVGGMFLIGYALKLKATNVQIGLMSTIPMLCVVTQLISSALVERGVSRRRMTIVGALLNVSGWVLVILIPRAPLPDAARIWVLIGIITLVTIFLQMSGNARGSWVGELIPAEYRGTFFGRLMMYAGVIGAVFALLEGTFLDHVKAMGISAFSWLFAFGILFGVANAALFLPQPDILVTRRTSSGFMTFVRETFANKALMAVAVYALLWSMQLIAGPFYATYVLRDLHMPFLGLGVLNTVATIMMIFSSPFWGRMIDRYGCRPVLIACSSAVVPLPLAWIWMTKAQFVYPVIIPINLFSGFAAAGVSVALSTLIYKVTPEIGRSVQFAIYSIIVVLCAAPMPALGGYLPELFRHLWHNADLRVTFVAAVPFLLAAALAARRIPEPDARHTRELLRKLPSHLRREKRVE